MKLGERTFRFGNLFLAAIFTLLISAASFSQIEKSKADVSPQAIPSPPASSTQQSPAQKGGSPTSLQVSPDELYALQKLRIQKELQDEIIKWAQTRFWLLAIASLLVGFFGVRALVREFVSGELKEAMRASVEAQTAAESARESIREVRIEAGKYKDLVDSASTVAADVNEKLQGLKSRIDAEGARSVAAADLKITALGDQIEELRKTVTALATDSERSRNILKQAEFRIAQAREAAQTSEAEFSSNADINVLLVPFTDELSRKLAGEISASLTQKGFKVSQAPWGGKPAAHIGRDIRIAYQPIAKAKADTVAKIVRTLFQDRELHNEITMQEREYPIGNDPNTHVVIFFEKRTPNT